MGGIEGGATSARVPTLGFLVCGAAKSGTTTLHYLLRDHPAVRLPDDKEAPFFAKTVDVAGEWPAYALDHFGDLAPGMIAGKITPRYLGDLHAPSRVAEVAPDVRLAVLLRHPVDRAFSKYRLLLRQGKTSLTFDEHVARQLTPAALETARNSVVAIADSNIVRSEYGRQLQRWLMHFDPEQLRVFFTTELEEDPQKLIDELADHIGVEGGWVPPELGKRFYVGGDRQRFPGLVPTAKRVPGLTRLWALLPKKGRRRAHIWFNRQINVKRTAVDVQLDENTRRQLIEFYAPDVALLERIAGRPVPWSDFSPVDGARSTSQKAQT